MTVPYSVHLIRRQSRNELINYLAHKPDLDEFDFVHLSGHGDKDECSFNTPRGSLLPEDFPEDCFSGQTVTLSACALGNKRFIDRFINQTSAKNVIAPLKEIEFVDAVLWFVTFYYYALHIGSSPGRAYTKTHDSLTQVKGCLNFWS